MTAVMRFAEDRLSASIIISNSIRESLTGWQLDCTTNTSPPRTFSSILTRISPSLNDDTVAAPSLVPRKAQISWASAGFALPENIFSSLFIDSSEGPWMRLRHLLISYYMVRLDGGRRWA